MFFHRDGPESTLGFQTDLSSLQGATTVFSSVHFFGHPVTWLRIISPEEDSGEEAHLRKAEGREKPQTGGRKRSHCLRKDYEIFVFFFSKLKLLDLKIEYHKHHWLEIVLLASSGDTGLWFIHVCTIGAVRHNSYPQLFMTTGYLCK